MLKHISEIIFDQPILVITFFIKCVIKSFFHSQISTVVPLKFGNGQVMWPHTLKYMWLLIVLFCFITKSFLTYWFFPPTPALSIISRPLSSSMCSITPETANVGSSYTPGKKLLQNFPNLFFIVLDIEWLPKKLSVWRVYNWEHVWQKWVKLTI